MKIYILLIFAFLTSEIKSQNIVGLWQEGTPEISAAYHNTYNFLQDGTFSFNPSEYDGLKRILSIDGQYKLENDKLLLTITGTHELIGGTIERNTFSGTSTHLWSIEGGSIKKIIFPKQQKEIIDFEIKKEGENILIILDSYKFYKLKVN